MADNRFEIHKLRGRWYWELHKGSDTHPGPVARSARSYASLRTARASIETTKDAMNGAVVSMSGARKTVRKGRSH